MRMIDADEARENMLKLLDHHLMMCNYSADSATQDCIEVINEAAVVDAEPVVHGHWIYNKDTGEIRCNLCNALVGVTMYPDDVELITKVENFCFNCGAKMGEVSE